MSDSDRQSDRQSDLQKILACPSLPTLPSVAAELLRLTDDPDVRLDEIERLVVSDVGLSSRILRTINSSLYGLSTPCTSIKRAMAYLGLSAVKSLVLGFSMVDLSSDLEEVDGFSFREYWRRVIYGAAGARFVATMTQCCDPDEAFTAAMFQDMGMVAMLIVQREQYGTLVAEVGGDHERLSVVEQLVLGFNHPQVGSELAKRWNLPPAMAEVIRCHHHPEDSAAPAIQQMVRCLVLGRLAAASLRDCDSAGRLADLLVRAEVWFPGVVFDADTMLDRVAAAATDVASVLGRQVGPPPPVAEILAEANKQLFRQQLTAQRQLFESNKRERDLRQAALTDALTGISNRAHFDAELARRWAEMEVGGPSLAILFIDADKFKPVNDTHGHQVGDRILQDLAARLTELADDSGLVCRYGGEEFAVLVSGASQAQALAFGERAREAVASRVFGLSGIDGAPSELSITVSIGVASTDGPVEICRAEDLLRLADEGVYAAKAGGRNCVRISQGAVSEQAAAAMVSTPSLTGGTPISEVHAADTQASPTSSEAGHDAVTESGNVLTMESAVRVEREILFIDDDALARALIRTLLSRVEGIDRVRTASSAIAAIEVLRDWHGRGCMPMAVICDMELREKSALDVLRAVRAMPGLEQIPFVVITANPSKDVHDLCRKAGVDGVYSKDLLCQDLTRWIEEIKRLCSRLADAG